MTASRDQIRAVEPGELHAVAMMQGGWGAWVRVIVAATPAADTAARAFLGRQAGHIDHDLTGDDLAPWPALVSLYYPVCEHGMDGNLCAGPGHYPTDR